MRSVTWNWLTQKRNLFIVIESQAVTHNTDKKQKKTQSSNVTVKYNRI